MHLTKIFIFWQVHKAHGPELTAIFINLRRGKHDV